MHLRYLKIMFVVLVSLLALIYVAQNLVNVTAAHGAMVYVMSGPDHAVYTHSIGPRLSHPIFGWIAVVVVFSLEILTGLLTARGALAMWRARNADAQTFNRSKKWAQIGCGVGVLVWFGLFGVIGGAFFQMWQTEVGSGSLNDAFQFFAYCALTLLFLGQAEEQGR